MKIRCQWVKRSKEQAPTAYSLLLLRCKMVPSPILNKSYFSDLLNQTNIPGFLWPLDQTLHKQNTRTWHCAPWLQGTHSTCTLVEVGAKSGSALTPYRHIQSHSNKEFQKTSHLRGQWYLATPLAVLQTVHSPFCVI